MHFEDRLKDIVLPLGEAVRIDRGPAVIIREANQISRHMEQIVRTAVFGQEPDRHLAQWFIRECALESGIIPSSIHELYLARGQGETRNDFSVPAINLRSLPFHAARAVFRAAEECGAAAIVFEIARSEIGYTDQRPAEYASCVLGAALAEGFQGPVFLQGDHFQVSAKRYAAEPESEIQALKDLMREAVAAGFFNIDIDTSTLVDLTHETLPAQQRVNYTLSANLAAFARTLEPQGIILSIGGEIGEVGGHNSTEPELHAYMDGFNEKLEKINPDLTGLSKISIQTGTSHGGVVLPDGSVAKVKVDFDTLKALSDLARNAYGMAGAVQHGASTLPPEAFSHFAESTACEVHLATHFQNILYQKMPEELCQEIYAYLDDRHSNERKAGQTDEQFHYKTRKRALGPFKRKIWDMPENVRNEIEADWEKEFRLLFDRLNVKNTRKEVERHIEPLPIHVPLSSYLKPETLEQEMEGLAD